MFSEEEVIRLFLKNGYQLSKGALPLVLHNPHKILEDVSKLRPRPFIITEEHVKKIFTSSKKPKPEIIVLKRYEILKKQIKIKDYIKNFQTRYEKIKNILTERMRGENIISINKIPPYVSTFSVIGIVRRRGQNNILIEDPSGEATINFDTDIGKKLDEIKVDDVIGFTCKKMKENLIAKNIYFPETPSSREINKADEGIKVAFLFDPPSLEKKQQKKLYDILNKDELLSSVFVFKTSSIKKEEHPKLNLIEITKDSAPTLFQIDKIKILVLQKKFFSLSKEVEPLNFIISILRHRNLIRSFDPKIHIGDNNFVLDEPPDIIVSDFEGGFYKNFKGTTIVLNSDPTKLFLINLKTREVIEKSL